MDELTGSESFCISDISSSADIIRGGDDLNQLNYLFVYDSENNNYEFNNKCEKDLQNDDVILTKEFQNRGIPQKRNAVSYFKEIIAKINKEIQDPSSKIPVKSRVVHFLKYFGCLLVFLIIIYFFLLILVLFLFNPMIIILEILFVKTYLNFFITVKSGINESTKKTKIISLLDEENGKYTHKNKQIEWTYGRDGSWIEIKYLKKINNRRP